MVCDPVSANVGVNLYVFARLNLLKFIDNNGKQDHPADSGSLSREQVLSIMSKSRSLNDLKLNLGLGPVTDKYLASYLTKKGILSNSAQNQSEFHYQGPSVGPARKDQRITGRIIYYSDPEGMGFIPRYEQATTEAELERRQEEANLEGNAQEAGRLLALGGGLAAGVQRAKTTGRALPDIRPSVDGAPVDTVPQAISPAVATSQAAYSARSEELLKAAVRPQQRTLTTIDVGPAMDPSGKTVTLISSTVPIDPSHLKPGEVLVPYSGGHAEIQKIRYAIDKGYKVLYVNPSLPLCANCAFQARKAGLALPGAMVSQGPGKPAVLLSSLSDAQLAELASGQLGPRYKTHEKR